MHARLVAIVASVLVVVVASLPARAAEPARAEPGSGPGRGAPGTWTAFAGSTLKASRQVATLRTADGRLHVAYVQDEPDGTDTLLHASFDAAGRFLGANPIVQFWDGINGSVRLVATAGGGMRVLFGGFDLPTNNEYLWSATSDAVGSSWTLGVVPDGETQAARSNGLAATTLGDGTPVYAYPVGGGMFTAQVGAGTSNFDDGFCCLDNPSLVASGTDAFVAYTANGGAAGNTGTFVRQVQPAVGAPSTTLKAPLSSVGGATSGNQQAVPLVQRGPQMWAAYCVGYPSCSYVGLWQYGTTRVVKVPGSADARNIAMTLDPQLRFWVSWTDTQGRIKAVRSAPTGPRFGAVRTLARPGSATPGTLGLSAQSARVDLVVASGNRLHHQQVLPGLTLKATPSRWSGDRRKRVTFAVTDAGVAVRGALVRAGGKRCTTTARGTCSVSFAAGSRPKRFSARATKASYAAATVRLRIT